MIEETMHPKDGDYIKFKTVRLPVETYGIRLGFRIKDEEAAKEAWRQLVKASGCSIITDPVLHEEFEIDHNKRTTVIEGAVVKHPNLPAPRVLRNPNYIEFYIQEDPND